VSVLVLMGVQAGWVRSAVASTTTERLVAQEIVNPNWLVRMPKFGPVVRTRGFGSDQTAVGRSPKVEPQPVVPGC